MPLIYVLLGLGFIGFGVSKMGDKKDATPAKEKTNDAPPEVDPTKPVSATEKE